MPASGEIINFVKLKGQEIENLALLNPLTKKIISELKELVIFPSKHFVSSEPQREKAIEEIKKELASMFPYGEWLSKNRIKLDQISSGRHPKNDVPNFQQLLRVYGYHKEDIESILMPMASDGKNLS